jgi:hypothetical protein
MKWNGEFLRSMSDKTPVTILVVEKTSNGVSPLWEKVNIPNFQAQT